MKKQHKQKNDGFITLFFILGLSFTFLTWISLSSERVFQYIDIKDSFLKNRSVLHDTILCADAFVNILIESGYGLKINLGKFEFQRNLYFADNAACSVSHVDIRYGAGSEYIEKIFFNIDHYSFEYRLKGGFVNFIKSSHLVEPL